MPSKNELRDEGAVRTALMLGAVFEEYCPLRGWKIEGINWYSKTKAPVARLYICTFGFGIDSTGRAVLLKDMKGLDNGDGYKGLQQDSVCTEEPPK